MTGTGVLKTVRRGHVIAVGGRGSCRFRGQGGPHGGLSQG